MAGVDLATRLRRLSPSLESRLAERALLSAIVREANATLDPQHVGGLLIARFSEWIPADGWVVVARGAADALGVISTRDVEVGWPPTAVEIARRTIECEAFFASADAGTDPRLSGPRSAVAAVSFPLVARGRALGALVAFGDAPSADVPCVPPALAPLVCDLAEPIAIALDNALRFERAEALSVTDDLTRLYNFRYLNVVLRRESKRASRNGRPLSLLFVDLDGFKSVNDRFGHLAGSHALVQTATVLRTSARETDVVARYGGDEFALVLPDTNGDGAMAVARRVRERIAAYHFLADKGLDVRLTASVGVATLPDAALVPEELIQAADQAMYRVKERGKDGIDTAPPRADEGVLD